MLIEEINKCPYGKLREILRYLLLSSENNRKQYLYDYEIKYHIMQEEQMRMEENQRREKGIRRINVMSHRENVGKYNGNGQNESHFSKDNKIHTAVTVPNSLPPPPLI